MRSVKRKKRSLLRTLLRYISIAVIVVILIPGTLVGSVIASALYYKSHDAKLQLQRLEELEQRYASADFVPVKERDFTAFDLDAALENGLKFNEVQFLATHNSYKQRMSRASYYAMNWVAAPLGLAAEKDEWDYEFEPLTQQLDKGIRSIELDVMKDGESFRCGHVGVLDMSSNCHDLALTCQEIRMWSDAHPDHLPITILVEAKPSIAADGGMYKLIDLDGVEALGGIFRREFEDKLFTPSEMRGSYESFGALRRDNGWPALRDMLGKILILYHYNEATTADYIALSPSLDVQKMFPVLEYPVVEVDTDSATFILCNDPLDHDVIAAYTNKNLLVRTRIDMYMHHEQEKYDSGVTAGALLLTTDYPPRDNLGDDSYAAILPGGYTVQLQQGF